MTRHSRRLRVAALTAAALALLPITAHADPVVDLATDTIASGVDAALDLQRGCTPIVTSWTPYALNGTTPTTYALVMTPHIKNTSTWYLENGGAIAHLSCTASVMIRARVSDVSTGVAFRTYRGSYTPTFVTSKDPRDTGTNDVPYFGPDAPVLRPYGQVTVHVEVFRKVSTGRYAALRSGCTEFHYLVQPAASFQQTDAVATYDSQGACAYDAPYLVLDAYADSGAQGDVDTLLGTHVGHG